MARRSRTGYQRGPVGYGSLPRPPVSTYDPAIDASERAAQRGFGDLTLDTATGNTRAASNYGIGLEAINRQRGYGLADLSRSEARGNEDIGFQRSDIERGYGRNVADVNRGYARNLTDLLTSRTRGTEDYGVNIAGVERQFHQLAGRQAQSAAAAGVAAGGPLLQALQKRTENEALTRKPIDTGYDRFMSDSSLAESRLGEDKSTSLTRLGEDRATGLSRLDTAQTRLGEDTGTSRDRLIAELGTGQSTYKPGSNQWADAWLAKNPGKQLPGGPRDMGIAGQRLSLGYQRGAEDRATDLARGGRELTNYLQDLVPTRFYSAASLNRYTPPKRRR